MALTPKIFGISANTVSITGGPTGLVIETFDIGASTDQKELTGNNPGQKVIDIRATNLKETVTFTAEFETYVEPDQFAGKDATFGVSSDDTTPASPSVSGKVVDAKLTGHKGDWWQYTITVVKVDSGT